MESAFRFQMAGWRDGVEYESATGEAPSLWQEGEGEGIWPKKLLCKADPQSRDQGWAYYRKGRECEPRLLNRVKLYSY